MSTWMPVEKRLSTELRRWVNLDSGVIVSVRTGAQSARDAWKGNPAQLQVLVELGSGQTTEQCVWTWTDNAEGRAELSGWLKSWLGEAVGNLY